MWRKVTTVGALFVCGLAASHFLPKEFSYTVAPPAAVQSNLQAQALPYLTTSATTIETAPTHIGSSASIDQRFVGMLIHLRWLIDERMGEQSSTDIATLRKQVFSLMDDISEDKRDDNNDNESDLPSSFVITDTGVVTSGTWQATVITDAYLSDVLTLGTGTTFADDLLTPNSILTVGQTDEYCLTYEATGSTFEWQTCGVGSLASTDIDTSAELSGILVDETGSGRSVFSISPAFSGTPTFAALTATSTVTLSGGAANIALGSNYLSGDGDDEGVFVDGNGNVGIGISPSSRGRLLVATTRTDTAGFFTGSEITITANPSGNSTAINNGLSIYAESQTGNIRDMSGINGILSGAFHNGSGVLTNLDAVYAYTDNYGEVTNVTGVAAEGYNSGIITNQKFFEVTDLANFGTITNTYGVYVGDITNGTQTNTPYSFYASDANAKNYFAGNVGVGTTSPLAVVSVTNSGSGRSLLVEDSASPDSTPFVIDASGRVGIGKLTPRTDSLLDVDQTSEVTTGFVNATTLHMSANPPANSSGTYTAVNAYADTQGTQNINRINGVYGAAYHDGSGTLTNAWSVWADAGNFSSGIVSNMSSLHASTDNAGIINNLKILNIDTVANTGTLTNTYGLYIGDITSGAQTNQAYSVYASDVNTQNYFAGNTGVGTTTPWKDLSVSGDIVITGALFDSSGEAGTNGQVLLSTVSGTNWTATSSLGLTASLGNDSVTPDNIKTAGQTDEYCLTYESTATTWEWQPCNSTNVFTDGGSTTYLTSSDSLGIGTTTANQKLTVEGNINLSSATGAIYFDDTKFLYAAASNDSLAYGENAGATAGVATTFNTFFGYEAGRFASSTNVDYNNIMGYRAGYYNNRVGNNIIGQEAGYRNDGFENNLIGRQAGYNNTGNYNNIIGYGAGYSNNGDNNILIGYQAADTMTTGSNNIIIGYDIDNVTATADNRLNIGNLLFGTGLDGTGTTLSSGNVGIGTTTPNQKLSIFANGADAAIELSTISGADEKWTFGIDDSDGAKFKISSSSVLGTNDRLTIDGSGATAIRSNSATALTVGANGATNPVLTVNANTGSVATGLRITGAATGGTTALVATDSGTNANLSINAKGTGTLGIGTVSTGDITIGNNSADNINLNAGGGGTDSTNLQVGGVTYFSQSRILSNFTYSTVGALNHFTYTGPTESGLASTAEATSVSFNMGQTRTHTAGTIALQRDFRIIGSNHAFAGASTLTDYAILGLTYSTGNSTNGTITNTHGLYIPTAALGTGRVNSYGLTVEATTGAANNYAAQFMGGNVGIGTSTPVQKLQVFGDIRVGTSGTNGCLEGHGGAALAGTCSSDERLKTAITALNEGSGDESDYLERLVQLRPVHYKWNNLAGSLYYKDTSVDNIGLIAQEVEQLFPESVVENDDNYKQVNFANLPFYIIESIKELYSLLTGLEEKVQEIDDLKRRIETLEEKNNIQYEAPEPEPQPQTEPQPDPSPSENPEPEPPSQEPDVLPDSPSAELEPIVVSEDTEEPTFVLVPGVSE